MVKILRLWCKTQFLRELEGLGMGFCTSKQNWMVTGYDPKATRTSEPTKKPNDWWLNHVTSPNFLAEIRHNGWSSSDSININLFFWWIWWWISWWNPNVSKKTADRNLWPKWLKWPAARNPSAADVACRGVENGISGLGKNGNFKGQSRYSMLMDMYGIMIFIDFYIVYRYSYRYSRFSYSNYFWIFTVI